MSKETEQNYSFPTTQHKLVYVKLHINKFHSCILLLKKLALI